jgi:hypothetical protein
VVRHLQRRVKLQAFADLLFGDRVGQSLPDFFGLAEKFPCRRSQRCMDRIGETVSVKERHLHRISKTLAIGFLLLAGCSKNPDEVAILGLLETVRSNVEQKQFEAAVSHVSKDYSDNVGGKRERLVERLESVFGGYDQLKMNFKFDRPKIQGLGAAVVSRAKMSGIKGNQEEKLFGTLLLAREIHIFLAKRNGEWIITGCQLVQRQLLN